MTGYDAAVRTTRSTIGDVWIAIATAIGIVALTIPLFLNPVWVAFEQGRAQSTTWTGFSEPELRVATDAILADLVFGPPDFDVEVDGVAVLNERERSHMRDVRTVFAGFFVVALAAAAGAIIIAAGRRGDPRSATWRAVRAGALGLIVALVLGGLVSFVAFDVLFETFHRLFFPSGSYTFDPSTDRLVQLFPFVFWQETAMSVGAVSIVIGGIVAGLASRRLTAAHALARSASLQGSRV